MFTRDGYDSTTMQSIADAAGISRPTLFRYFPSKSDIVWDRYDEEAVQLRATLKAAPNDAEPLGVLCGVLPSLLKYEDADFDLLRTQVVIIANESAMQASAHARSEGWIAIMASFVAERLRLSASDLLPQVMSRCVWSAGWTALALWAAGDEERPDSYLRTAFSALQAGFSSDVVTAPENSGREI
jgi:AcrR family transcriptional regulator